MRFSAFSCFATVGGFAKFINAATIPIAAKCSCGPSFVTTTVPWTGTVTTTRTVRPSTSPGTVVIETPSCSLPTSSTPGQSSSPETVSSTSLGTHPGTTSVIPTTTPTLTTSTTTTVPNSACAVNPTCAASGLNIDYYSNKFGYNGYTGGGNEQTLPPSYYITEGLTPLASSLTNTTFFVQQYSSDVASYRTILGQDPNNPQVPYFVGYTRETNGGIVVDGNNFTLVYQGFYRAPVSGEYRFCSSADNINNFYIGIGQALTCDGNIPASPGNALLVSSPGGNFNNPISCTDLSLIAGQFYPIRSVMGNGDSVSAFNLTIQAPGTAPASTNTGSFYPVKCAAGS